MSNLRMNDLLQGIGPVTREEFRALVRSVINLQNVVRNTMDLMDANQQVANDNAQAMNQNCVNMLAAIQYIGQTVGIEVQGVNPAVQQQVDQINETAQEPEPDEPPKTVH